MTASEAKQVMRVAIRGVLCKRDEEIDSKELESQVNKQVAGLMSIAGGDQHKRVSLAEFKAYYSGMVKKGFEPEVLLLDIQRAISALKSAKYPKSPRRKKAKRGGAPALSPTECLGIVRLAGGKSGGAGRIRLTNTPTKDGKGLSTRVKGSLKGLPEAKKLRLECKLKQGRVVIKEFVTDGSGTAEVIGNSELPQGTQASDLVQNKDVRIVSVPGEQIVATVNVVQLHT